MSQRQLLLPKYDKKTGLSAQRQPGRVQELIDLVPL
jgi:hypothetical protein